MRLAWTAYFLGILVLPTMAAAQTYTSRSQSVILPAEYGWRNHVDVADGPCGCSTSVRTDVYHEHCPSRCYCAPLCLMEKACRMLDCLLPCNVCCGFGHGCVLGGRCGAGCGMGCGSRCGGCCTPSCTTSCKPSCC